MRRDYLIFDGVDSRDYGIILSGPDTTDAPERDVTFIEVPGRSGSLLIDNGRFRNKTLPYRAAIIRDFEARFAAFKMAMLSRPGYRRLEDSIHPEEYRLASFTGPIEPQTTPFNRAGEFDLTFNCMPQRYLKSGERAIQLTKSGASLINPGFPSKPLITVYGAGAGTLFVTGKAISFKPGFSGPIILDCDTQNAYYGAMNKNEEISAPEFPSLPSGKCTISWIGGIESVSIVPRWWNL